MTINLSNEFRLDLSVNDVMTEALEHLQATGQGEGFDGNDYLRCIGPLNRMLKSWEGQGIHLWTQQEGTLFTRVGQSEYDMDNTGKDGADDDFTHYANTWRETTLGAALDVSVDADQLTLASVTDLTVGMMIGVVNSDLDLEWRRVMSITALVVQVETAFTVDAASGGTVYFYAYDQATIGSVLITATTFTPSDISLFQAGDAVSYELDTGGYERNTVVSVGATTFELLTGATAAVTGLGIVNLEHRAFDFKPVKRVVAEGVRRREGSDYEIPVVYQSRQDYFDLPNKNQRGTVIQTYYSRQEPYGVWYVWLTPSDATPVINFTYERSLMIVNDPTQTFDLPEDWYEALTANLARRLIPKYGCSTERKQEIKELATETLDVALAMDQEVHGIRMVPQQYG